MDEKNMQSPQDYYAGPEMEPVMGVGQWLVTLLVMSIPCLNIVMLFVWGFGGGNQTRANYCKAYLIWFVIFTVLTLVLSMLFGAAMSAAITSSMGSL